jgi:hypothetical protein
MRSDLSMRIVGILGTWVGGLSVDKSKRAAAVAAAAAAVSVHQGPCVCSRIYIPSHPSSTHAQHSPLLVMHFQGQRLAAIVNSAFAARFLSAAEIEAERQASRGVSCVSFYLFSYFII